MRARASGVVVAAAMAAVLVAAAASLWATAIAAR